MGVLLPAAGLKDFFAELGGANMLATKLVTTTPVEGLVVLLRVQETLKPRQSQS